MRKCKNIYLNDRPFVGDTRSSDVLIQPRIGRIRSRHRAGWQRCVEAQRASCATVVLCTVRMKRDCVNVYLKRLAAYKGRVSVLVRFVSKKKMRKLIVRMPMRERVFCVVCTCEYTCECAFAVCVYVCMCVRLS